jgi:hypothetical protein
VRTVAIARSAPFALPQYIGTAAARACGELADENWLRNLDFRRFVPRLAHHLAEIKPV